MNSRYPDAAILKRAAELGHPFALAWMARVTEGAEIVFFSIGSLRSVLDLAPLVLVTSIDIHVKRIKEERRCVSSRGPSCIDVEVVVKNRSIAITKLCLVISIQPDDVLFTNRLESDPPATVYLGMLKKLQYAAVKVLSDLML